MIIEEVTEAVADDPQNLMNSNIRLLINYSGLDLAVGRSFQAGQLHRRCIQNIRLSAADYGYQFNYKVDRMSNAMAK